MSRKKQASRLIAPSDSPYNDGRRKKDGARVGRPVETSIEMYKKAEGNEKARLRHIILMRIRRNEKRPNPQDLTKLKHAIGFGAPRGRPRTAESLHAEDQDKLQRAVYMRNYRLNQKAEAGAKTYKTRKIEPNKASLRSKRKNSGHRMPTRQSKLNPATESSGSCVNNTEAPGSAKKPRGSSSSDSGSAIKGSATEAQKNDLQHRKSPRWTLSTTGPPDSRSESGSANAQVETLEQTEGSKRRISARLASLEDDPEGRRGKRQCRWTSFANR